MIEVQSIAVPGFIYGTAWKEERTAGLVGLALAAGFRAIDTANQRKHYFEAGVGEAIAAGGVARDELWLQTKFTYVRGQDQRLPYEPSAPLATQLEQSFTSSLEHLGVDLLDSYILHGPWSDAGWHRNDRQVWAAMESLQRAGRARLIGVSNIGLDQLAILCDEAEVAPAFVQNRCYARTGWDREVRALCRDRGIVYQGFSLLTANRRELAEPEVAAIAARAGASVPQLVFRFAQAIGILPLTGTSNPEHMRQDLAAAELELEPADAVALERLAG
ncbi:MAG TPA: aldo/keto reductase [Kofleriaceae bacterium]|nr:aldo/keto reductase [Kofleriaceae bacterium]